jgi:hypothetical protein
VCVKSRRPSCRTHQPGRPLADFVKVA